MAYKIRKPIKSGSLRAKLKEVTAQRDELAMKLNYLIEQINQAGKLVQPASMEDMARVATGKEVDGKSL